MPHFLPHFHDGRENSKISAITPEFFKEPIITLLKIKIYFRSEISTEVLTRFAPSRPYLEDEMVPEGAAGKEEGRV